MTTYSKKTAVKADASKPVKGMFMGGIVGAARVGIGAARGMLGGAPAAAPAVARATKQPGMARLRPRGYTP